MISRKISGLTTTMAEPTAVIPSSSTICLRYRRRYGQTRRTVPGRTCCPVTSSSRYRSMNSGPEIMRSTLKGQFGSTLAEYMPWVQDPPLGA